MNRSKPTASLEVHYPLPIKNLISAAWLAMPHHFNATLWPTTSQKSQQYKSVLFPASLPQGKELGMVKTKSWD